MNKEIFDLFGKLIQEARSKGERFLTLEIPMDSRFRKEFHPISVWMKVIARHYDVVVGETNYSRFVFDIFIPDPDPKQVFMKELISELRQIRETLQFAPGGPIYQESKAHFSSILSQQHSNKKRKFEDGGDDSGSK